MKNATWILAVLVLLVSGVEQAKAGTVIVDPSNLNGWVPFGTDGNGVVGNNSTASETFVTGPATPPLGIGSLQLTVGNGTGGGDGSAQVASSNFDGTLLSSLTTLSYSTYDTHNNGQQFPYMFLNVNLAGNSGTNYDQLFFEPPYQTHSTGNPSLPDQGATVMNKWQTWNALEGGWWDNNGVLGTAGTGVEPLSNLIAKYPNATIVTVSNLFGPNAPAYCVSLNVGYASATDQFNGYVDNFTIGTANGTTTYNFEPNAAVPEPSTLTLLGIGAVCLVGYGRRRRRQSA